MSYFIHIILGFGLSLIGSLPLGIINMTVAETTIRRGLKAGLLVAAGASLVEFVQAFIAIKFIYLFMDNPKVDFVFNIIALIVFWALGIYFLFFAKAPEPKAKPKTETKKRTHFSKGMLVSSMNVLVIPYWIFYGTYLSTNDWLRMEVDYICVFVSGVTLGAFMAFFLYAKLGQLITNRAEKLTTFVNKFIGLILIGFGVYQIWKAVHGLF